MGVHYADNPWWLDVLEWGPKSPCAASFDIDWETLPAHPRGGVLIPVLGSPYGEALERGEIELRYDAAEGSFSAWYFEHRLPIAPNRYGEIVQKAVAEAGAGEERAGRKLWNGPSAIAARTIPRVHGAGLQGGARFDRRRQGRDRTRPARLSRRLRASGRRRRAPLPARAPELSLAHWRLAGSEINYRRFFDINTLAGLCVEDRGTFDAIHALVRRLIAEGRCMDCAWITSIGLRDPHQYFRPSARLSRSNGGQRAVVLRGSGKDPERGERLPRFAGVAGTTGYEWLNIISRLLLDNRGLAVLERTWRDVRGESPASMPFSSMPSGG
jgi:(1->4)-alpha-D-glucan 1-alpha-D-glucosylmutase